MTDPLFARLQDLLDRQPFSRWMGARLTRVAPGEAEFVVPMRPELTQQDGFAHGGIVATLCDIAGGFAGWTTMAPDANILTVEFKVNMLAPAQGEVLRASGRVLRAGRTLTVTEVRVFGEAGGVATLAAAGQQTLMAVTKRG